MSKFKVGDRVVANPDSKPSLRNYGIGTITKIYPREPYPYEVRFDNNQGDYVYDGKELVFDNSCLIKEWFGVKND